MIHTFEKIFTGEHKYTIGMIYMFANLAGFFLNMRKLRIDDCTSICILSIFVAVARYII
jgi:uncharacterized membrane protein YjjP (DUF1212 family)